MALGRVVGRARVRVSADLQPASLTKVGKQIERQLSAISKRNGRLYRSLGADMVTAWRGALGAIVTGAPLMGSAVSALSGGVTMLAGSLWSTATAASAVLPLLTSVGVAAGTAKIAFEGFGSAVSASDPEALAAALERLSPAAGASALAVRSLSDEATKLRLAVQENFFAGLADDIEKLGTTLFPVATAGMSKMASVLNGLAQSILDYVNSSAGLSVINETFTNSASIIKTLSGAVVPFLDGFLRLVNALSPAAERLAGRITDIALRFQSWTQAEGFATRIDEGMQKAEKTAGLLFDVIGNLGSAILNIFDAANPSTNTFLEILGRVTGRFKEFTESVGGQEAIAKWASESVTVLSQFGETIKAVFQVLQDLSDPRVITSFLATVQHAFELLGNLPLERMVSLFADWAEALQPISGPMLAIIVAGVSLQMMLGSLMGQMAGAVGVFGVFRTTIGGMGKSLGKLRTNFAGIGKSAGGLGKITGIFKTLGGVLAKGLKFAGLAGLAVTIVMVIAKSEALQSKLKEVWSSLKGVFESLGGAFSQIGSSAGPLLSALDPVFNVFEKIVGLAVWVVLDTIRFAFDSLAKTIQGVGTVVSGFLKILTGIFTLDFGMIVEGLKTALSGIPALLEGVMGLFVTFFAPARFLSIGSKLFGGLLTGLRSAFPAVTTAVGGLVSRILRFFVELGPRLLSAGGAAVRRLGEGISGAFTAIRTFISGFIDDFVITLQTGFAFVRGLVDNAMTGIKTVFTTIWNGIVVAVRFVWDEIMLVFNTSLALLRTIWDAGIAALRVVIDTVFVPIGTAIRGLLTAVVDVIRASMELIGAYWRIGWDAVSTAVSTVLAYVGGAIRAGMTAIRTVVRNVMDAVGKIFRSVWDTISTVVGDALAYLGGAIRAGMTAARNTISSVLTAIRNFFTNAWDTISSTVTRVLSTIWSAISTRMASIRTAISTAMDTVKSVISRAFESAREAVGRAMTAIGTAVSNGVSSVLRTIRSLPGKILSALGDLGSLLTSAGRKLIGGLVDGITGSIGRVTGAMGTVASKIRSFLPGSPIKEGPLRSWNNGGAGKRLVDLLTDGINDRQRDVERSVGQLASILAGVGGTGGVGGGMVTLPTLTGSPSRASTTTAVPSESTPSAPNAGGTIVNVTIDPKDLEGLRTVQEFVTMLNVRTAMVRGV